MQVSKALAEQINSIAEEKVIEPGATVDRAVDAVWSLDEGGSQQAARILAVIFLHGVGERGAESGDTPGMGPAEGYGENWTSADMC